MLFHGVWGGHSDRGKTKYRNTGFRYIFPVFRYRYSTDTDPVFLRVSVSHPHTGILVRRIFGSVRYRYRYPSLTVAGEVPIPRPLRGKPINAVFVRTSNMLVPFTTYHTNSKQDSRDKPIHLVSCPEKVSRKMDGLSSQLSTLEAPRLRSSNDNFIKCYQPSYICASSMRTEISTGRIILRPCHTIPCIEPL